MTQGLISASHRRSVEAMRGETGRTWLRGIPDAIAWCERAWSIRLTRSMDNLRLNFVAHACLLDGTPVILKLCPTDERELYTQIDALRLFDGRGSVRLLAFDAGRGALLIEAAQPGTLLDALEDDDEKTRAMVEVMPRLWRPVPPQHTFPTVEYWATGVDRLLRSRFGGGTGPIPPSLVERAEKLFAELLPSQAARVVLHGDLHWENILAAQREPWLAIDPKGVVGEPAYELGAMLRNGLPPNAAANAVARVLTRRIDLACEMLALPHDRVRAWGFAQLILSAVWSVDDSQDPLWRTELYADALR